VLGIVIAFIDLSIIFISLLALLIKFACIYPTHGTVTTLPPAFLTTLANISTGLLFVDGFISMFLLAVCGGVCFLFGYYSMDLSVNLLDGTVSCVNIMNKQVWTKMTKEMMTTQAGYRISRANLVRIYKKYIIFSLLTAVIMTVLGELGAFVVFPAALGAIILIAAIGFIAAISELDANLIPILRK
jgi:hypothetical protein